MAAMGTSQNQRNRSIPMDAANVMNAQTTGSWSMPDALPMIMAVATATGPRSLCFMVFLSLIVACKSCHESGVAENHNYILEKSDD